MSTDLHNEREMTVDSADFAHTLARSMERVVNTRTVYGEAVTQDGVTVIPVARAGWVGVGGGGGDRSAKESGSGIGGALRVRPVGYIEIKDGKTRFKAFFDLGIVVQIVLSYGIVTAITLNGVRKIIHAARQKS